MKFTIDCNLKRTPVEQDAEVSLDITKDYPEVTTEEEGKKLIEAWAEAHSVRIISIKVVKEHCSYKTTNLGNISIGGCFIK